VRTYRAIDAWLEYLPLRADTVEMVEILEILCGFIRRFELAPPLPLSPCLVCVCSSLLT
jgi:hypothetical protein